MNSNPSRQWHTFEYAHVFLWLIKDLCWAQNWTTLGVLMAIPTITLAYIITWLLRDKLVNLIHNIAISIWITSNSAWMLAEFYQIEPTLKPWAIAGFVTGIMILVIYYGYAFYRSRMLKRS